MRQATHYAEWCLRNGGEIPPTAMAFNKDGVLLMVPPRMGSEKDKDDFANAARMLAIGYEVDAVCMILESWAVVASRPGQKVPDCPPSQSPDRVEVVAISGEVKGISVQQILRIQRDARGNFSGFSILSESDGMQGRFAEILPPIKPDETQAQMARFAIAGMGYLVEGRGPDPIWN
jgi:hypothetical protein